jgi:CspA family cold shock protein
LSLRAFPQAALNSDLTGAIPVPVLTRALRAWRKQMASGTVKFFNSQKGFGFIQQDNGQPDVFVHVSAVERAGWRGLAEGQKLTFDIVTERGKSAAANLQTA